MVDKKKINAFQELLKKRILIDSQVQVSALSNYRYKKLFVAINATFFFSVVNEY